MRSEIISNAWAEIEVNIVPGCEDVDSDYQPSTDNSDNEHIEFENDRSSSNSEHETNEVEIDTNKDIGRPQKGRKRKYSGQTFKTKKMLQHANKPYYTEQGKFVPAKKFLSNYQCNCARKCANLISEERRKLIFENFYKLANYDAQTAFIAAKIQGIPVKRKRNKNSDKRSFTRSYRLETISVCKDFFIKTLGVSSKRINGKGGNNLTKKTR